MVVVGGGWLSVRHWISVTRFFIGGGPTPEKRVAENGVSVTVIIIIIILNRAIEG